jgi:hypothetical protein
VGDELNVQVAEDSYPCMVSCGLLLTRGSAKYASENDNYTQITSQKSNIILYSISA